jgi:uncharacterized short protein YbdD (DUF466 family)
MRAISMRAQFRRSQLNSPLPKSGAALSGVKKIARNIWFGVREWCGDRAYDRYVQAQKSKSTQAPLLSPEEFYVEQLNRRYSRPNRCC